MEVANTVWGELEPVEADIDFDQLEDEFAAKATATLKGGGRTDNAPKQKMLLTMQRAQNVSVFLAKLKLTPAQVRPAISPTGKHATLMPVTARHFQASLRFDIIYRSILCSADI